MVCVEVLITFYGRTTVHSADSCEYSNEWVSSVVEDLYGVPSKYVRVVAPENVLGRCYSVEVFLKTLLLGGKGGFGAALRASGKAGRVQTTSFGACRDLNGRRLRHVNNEIRLRLWNQQQEVRKRASERGAPLKESDIEDFDKNTRTGIDGWHLDVPNWAEGIGKIKRRRQQGRKTRLCINWVRAREEGSVPKGAPHWWGCPRGQCCDFAHGEEELDEDVQRKLREKQREEKRAKNREKLLNHTRQLVEVEDKMPNAVSEGLLRAAAMAAKKRLSKAKEMGEILSVKNELPHLLNQNLSRNIPIDCLAGELGIGDTGEIEGRSEFGTAALPESAVTDGSWYYEAEILTDDIIQIGIGTDKFLPDQVNGDGVGDKASSWGYDGSRNIIFDQGKEIPVDFPKWKPGDIVGCYLILGKEKSSLTFTLNGKVVCSLVLVSSQSSTYYFAAVSLNSGQAVRLNCGQHPFRFSDKMKRAQPFLHAYADLEGKDQVVVSEDKSQRMKEKAKVNKIPEASEHVSKAQVAKPETIREAKSQSKKSELELVDDIDLDSCGSIEELKKYSLEQLKTALSRRGLKCGGTLDERATRLFAIKGKKPEEYDRKLLAKRKIR